LIRCALVLFTIAACSFEVPPPGTLKCEPDGSCPTDYACVHGFCVPPEVVPGSGEAPAATR
jgi:hypothetical protein